MLHSTKNVVRFGSHGCVCVCVRVINIVIVYSANLPAVQLPDKTGSFKETCFTFATQ